MTHADHFYGTVPVIRGVKKEEIEKNLELNTGRVIIETFREQRINPSQMPACLVASHGPFVWGNNLKDAMGNAIVLEYRARLNLNTLITSGKRCDDIKSVSDYLLDKHFLRKHGKNAYYGQK